MPTQNRQKIGGNRAKFLAKKSFLWALFTAFNMEVNGECIFNEILQKLVENIFWKLYKW